MRGALSLWLVGILALGLGCQQRPGLGPKPFAWSGDRLDVGFAPERILCQDGRLYLASRTQAVMVEEKTGRLLRRFVGIAQNVSWKRPAGNAAAGQRKPATRVAAQGNSAEVGAQVGMAEADVAAAGPEPAETATGPEEGELRSCWIGSIAVAGGRLFTPETFAGNLIAWEIDDPSAPPLRVRLPDQGELVAAPSGREVYYADNETAFYRIEPLTLRMTRVAYPAGSKGIGAAAVSPEGRTLYLAIQRGAKEAGAEAPSPEAGPANPLRQTYSGPLLAEYDLFENRYTALRSIGDTRVARGDDASCPTGLAFGPDGRTLFITMWQCGVGVHVYDAVEHRLRRPLTLPDAPTSSGGQWPNCWGAAQVGDELYVTVASHLVRVHLPTGRLTDLGPSGRAVCPTNDGLLYVATPTGIRRISGMRHGAGVAGSVNR